MDHTQITLNAETSSQGSSETLQKNKRGRTKSKFTSGLNAGEKREISVDDVGQVISDNAHEFSIWLGTIARDNRLLPITRNTWRHVAKDEKQRVWDHIKDKVIVDEGMRRIIMQSVGKKWRDYKYDLKAKYYTGCPTDKDRYDYHPEDLPSEDWQILVNFWESEEGQKRTERNKRNRSCQKLHHTAGTKSFARVRHEEQLKRDSSTPPSRAEVFVITHYHKDGTPVNDLAAEKIQEIKARLPKDGSVDSTGPDDVYSKVFGAKEKPGRVRGLGLGPTPTSLWGPSTQHASSSTEFVAMKDKVHMLEEQLRQNHEQQKQKDVEVAEKLKQNEANMAKLMRIVEAMSGQLGGNINPAP